MAYPQTIDEEEELVDGVSPLSAADINSIRNSILAIERELGILPSGTFGTVSDRLSSIVEPTFSAEDILTDEDGYLAGLSIEQVLREQFIESTLSSTRYLFFCVDDVEEKTYSLLLNSPTYGVITSISVETNSGTCEVSFLIDDIELDLLSASSLRQISNYSVDNSFSLGSNITLSVSNLSEPVMLKITVEYNV